ncbi:hypothetical protein [Rahnella contaminans]|uniref:hypothetical protein n=1 Tax=Rahnella contaminans TaxID=2703882 RepID=UPI003C2BB85C
MVGIVSEYILIVLITAVITLTIVTLVIRKENLYLLSKIDENDTFLMSLSKNNKIREEVARKEGYDAAVEVLRMESYRMLTMEDEIANLRKKLIQNDIPINEIPSYFDYFK